LFSILEGVDQVSCQEISALLDPLADFIVEMTTTTTYECQEMYIRLAILIVKKYCTSIPRFTKALSRHTHNLVSALKSSHKSTGLEAKYARCVQLQILELLMLLVATKEPSVLKTMELYKHVEYIFGFLFDQIACHIFFHVGMRFVRCVLAADCPSLITQELVNYLLGSLKEGDARRVYIEAIVHEIMTAPTYARYFPSDMVTSSSIPTRLYPLETEADKLKKQIQDLENQLKGKAVQPVAHHEGPNKYNPTSPAITSNQPPNQWGITSQPSLLKRDLKSVTSNTYNINADAADANSNANANANANSNVNSNTFNASTYTNSNTTNAIPKEVETSADSKNSKNVDLQPANGTSARRPKPWANAYAAYSQFSNSGSKKRS